MQFPVRTELQVLQDFVGPAYWLRELEQHGSIAVRVPAPMTDDPEEEDNLLGERDIAEGLQVLIREIPAGFYMTPLARDGDRWCVTWGLRRVPVVYSRERRCWVVPGLPWAVSQGYPFDKTV